MKFWLILSVTLLLSACSGSPPANIGIRDNQLAPCPDSPNCVSSYAAVPDQAIRPLNANLQTIEAVVRKLDEARVIESTQNYLHVEFTSAVFRFVDDVEFLWDEKSNVTQVRSSSRLGYSDLGVNRARVERLRKMVE